jgi:hypothetical protein
MNDQLVSSVVTVLLAIVGVALVATLVSNNANTAGVLTSGGNAFSTSLGAALSPVSGGSLSSLGATL